MRTEKSPLPDYRPGVSTLLPLLRHAENYTYICAGSQLYFPLIHITVEPGFLEIGERIAQARNELSSHGKRPRPEPVCWEPFVSLLL